MNSRAELKVEGGKLLRADVSVTDEIEAVELHGDFFVYPEEALDRIEAAVEGVPVDAAPDELADGIEAAAADAALVGFDPEDVAAVLREAVSDAE
ncbi:MAG: biotin--protein ligase [Candidatus Nanohaloarchaea archaeon]